MTDQPAATKPDNLIGICNALGEELGVNPLWPRLVFASAFIFDPLMVLASYFALGAVILVARLVFPRTPRRRRSAEVITLDTPPVEAPVELARAA